MAQANIGSRRASEELIIQRRVRVNGEIATLGDKADPDVDVIEVDGQRLNFENRKIYIALNKPLNVLTTSQPHHTDDRRTVLDLVPMPDQHIFTIGRLDADSDGLVILTNDGELANKLAHPRFRHTKTYRVVVEGLPTAETVEKWMRGGIFLTEEEGVTAPCYVRITKGSVKETVLRIVMVEGKKRQIRRVAAILGHPVLSLRRIALGMLELGELKPGEWRELRPQEVALLQSKAPEYGEIPRARRPRVERTAQDPYEERPRRPATGGTYERPRRARTDDDEARDLPPRRAPSDRPRRPRSTVINPFIARENPDNAPEWRKGAQNLQSEWSAADRPRRPRPEGASRGDRPYRKRTEGSSGDYSDRPRRPRPEGASSGDRPYRKRTEGGSGDYSDRPRRPRPEGASSSERSDRPRRPRPEGASSGERSDRPRRPRPEGASSGERSDRPRRPRPEGASSSERSDRPRRPRPEGASSGERSDRPRRPRPESSSGDQADRPRRSRSESPDSAPRREDDDR